MSCSQSEDMFWSVDTVNFVIDTGVEKRFVSDEREHLAYCFVLIKIADSNFNMIRKGYW